MIFVGDIAHPLREAPSWHALTTLRGSQPVVANLEGPLCNDLTYLKKRCIFNHPSILTSLKGLGVCAVSLANNHILDIPHAFAKTLDQLPSHGIGVFGAGYNLEEAARPLVLSYTGRTYVCLAFGWRAIGCRAAGKDAPGVNPLRRDAMLQQIRLARHANPNATVVAIVHWNYEMEIYPQPAHRRLAKSAIEAGADVVVGHHPHRLGGIERHQDGIIAYSLGNWWFPAGHYFAGSIDYGEEATLQAALEIAPDKGAFCHLFRYDPKVDSIKHVRSESADTSRELAARTPFRGMGDKEYSAWFAANRVKRRFLPIYDNPESRLADSLRDGYVQLRHRAIVALENTGMRSRARRHAA